MTALSAPLPTTPDGIRWLLQSAADVPAGDDWLAPLERVRLAQLRVAKRRADWRLGRWTGKRAVAAALGVAAERVAIIAAAGGAPLALLDGVPAPLALSLSHAGGRGLCAIAPAGVAVGCDLEVVAARGQAFAADYLSPAERAQAGDDARLVTLLWCAKEAALKAIGEGLREDPLAVAVRLGAAQAGEWRSITAACAGRQLAGWTRRVGDCAAAILTGETRSAQATGS